MAQPYVQRDSDLLAQRSAEFAMASEYRLLVTRETCERARERVERGRRANERLKRISDRPTAFRRAAS